MEFKFEFNFGGIIKMNFSNKLASTIVSLIGTKIVLTNGSFGWDVCELIDHQLIHQNS